jgi:hypothetical protein
MMVSMFAASIIDRRTYIWALAIRLIIAGSDLLKPWWLGVT